MSSPNLAAAREALLLAKERYPAPVAHVAGELLYELSAPRPNYMRCFLLEIDLFEVSVTFFAFIELAELARRGKARASEAAVRQLRDNPILSTGHWWGLLRETSRDIRDGDVTDAPAVVRELAALYFDTSGRAGKIGQVLDQVPGLRNRVKGHGWTLTEEQYEKHALDLLETIKNYLSFLDGLTNHVLFLCVGSEGDDEECRLDLLELQGDSRRPHRRQARGTGSFRRGQVYIASKDGVRAGLLDAAAALCLHPFVQVRGRDGRHEGLYLLQALQKDHAELRGVVGSDTVSCAASLTEARELLDRLLAAGGSGPFDRLRQAVVQLNREALASPHGQASYHAEKYFVRPRLLRRVEEFFVSKAPAALLAGPSGMGKTALACHLADRWLLSVEKDRCVLLVLAHEVAAAGSSLNQWCQRRLACSLDAIRKTAADAKARVVVVVDGVDRIGTPSAVSALVTDALGCARAGPPEALRFLFTTTETGLAALTVAGRVPGEGDLPVLAIPPLATLEARRVYDLFRGPGGAEPEDELLQALNTPLLLRLAHAASASGAGRDRGASQVLLAYAEDVVFSDLSRTAIITRVVEEMLRTGDRAVPVADLMRDSALTSALLADGQDAPLRALIREGILSVERLPAKHGLPSPGTPHIGFTFDYLRDFVVFSHLADCFHKDQSSFRQFASAAELPLPFIGGLRFLIQERLRGGDPNEIRGQLVSFLLQLPPLAQKALLHQLFTLRIEPDGPLSQLLSVVFGLLDRAGRHAFIEAAAAAFDRLEKRGQIKEAGALCALITRLGQGMERDAVLPILFAWSRLQLRADSADKSAKTAEAAVAEARASGDRSLVVEALTCLDAALDALAERERRTAVGASLRAESLEGLRPRAEFAARMWEAQALSHEQPERSRSALERAKTLAQEQPRWLAEALLVELDHRMREEKTVSGISEETAKLIETALRAAQRAGHPGLEAEVWQQAAWRQSRDPSSEVEAGLEAAEAAGDRLAKAELLRCRAQASIARGRFAEAGSDAEEAGQLLQRLGHRYRELKTRQRITAICEWELGRDGKALAIWRKLLDDLQAMEKFREAALSALLVAEVACNLGNVAEAKEMLTRSRSLADRVGPQHALNFDLVEAQVHQLEGQTEPALAALEEARKWGREVRFLDFIFQPGILAARFLLEQSPADSAALERARGILNELLEDPSIEEETRNRYAGELYSLYALYNLERKSPEEAGVWLKRADRWFMDKPTHRAALLWRALKLLADHVTAEALSKSQAVPAGKGRPDALQNKARGLRDKVKEGVDPRVLAPLRERAGSFADPDEGKAFVKHHPARRLLVRHGIIPTSGTLP